MTGPGTRVEVVAGAGTVLRHGGVVAWAGDGASPELLRWLERSAANLAPSPRGGQLLAEHLHGLLADRDPEPDVPWVTAGPDGAGGLAVVLHGDVQLWDGGAWRRGPGPGRADVTGVAATPVVLVGALGATAPAASSHPLLDLADGVVPGGGFALLADADAAAADAAAGETTAAVRSTGATAVMPAAGAGSAAGDETLASRAPDAETVAVPAPGAGTVAVPASVGPVGAPTPGAAGRPEGVIGLDPPPGGAAPPAAPPAASSPAPVVGGARCPAGHLNPPGAVACARCGRVVPDPARRVSGPRPPLGVLVADDGSIWRLDRPYLVGADPGGDPAVTGGTVRALPLGGGRVAPVHAEIRLTDWAVSVVDRGSGSPVHVLGPGQDSWRPLEPWRPEPLAPGTHIALGDRVLTWVSPWPAGSP